DPEPISEFDGEKKAGRTRPASCMWTLPDSGAAGGRATVQALVASAVSHGDAAADRAGRRVRLVEEEGGERIGAHGDRAFSLFAMAISGTLSRFVGAASTGVASWPASSSEGRNFSASQRKM